MFIVFLACHSSSREEYNATHANTYSYIENTKRSFFTINLEKFLSILIPLYREVAFIPCKHALVAMFYCERYTEDGTSYSTVNSCKGATHIVFMLLSTIALIFSVSLVLVSSIFFNDTQPDSKLPWANCDLSVVLLKQLEKAIVVAYIILHGEASGIKLVILILIAILTIFIMSRLIKHLYMNDEYIHGCILCFESSLMWICLMGLLQRIFDLDFIHDIHILCAIPISYIITRYIVNRRSNNLIYSSKVEYLLDQSDMIQYVLLLSRIFHGQSACENYVILQGVFANHIRSCALNNCPCEDITRTSEVGGGEESLSASTSMVKSIRTISIKQTIQRNLSVYSAEIQLTEYNSIGKRKFFEFTRKLVERALTMVIKVTKLYVQLGYIHFIYLENKFIALYDLMNAQDTKPSLFDEFTIYRLK